ncbi:MAG: helix-turn-helix domain-containing protein [Tepidisphaeraceae bacterium]
MGDDDAAEQRGDGFAQAVAQKLNGRNHTFLREDAAHTFSDSEFAAWLLTLPRPLACFCGHDALAARVTRCMSPESAIAVLGVGDDPLICEFAEPPVSSIDINAAGIGKRAGELLARRLHGKSAGSVSVQPWGVTERASTRVLAIDDPDVAAALRFIRAQAASSIRIADIVEATSLTRRSLERRFAKLLQRSPAEVLRRERVGIAQRLLSTSDASIGQIARRSGFALPQHLAAAFRQSVGQTPSDYRQQRRAMPGVQK